MGWGKPFSKKGWGTQLAKLGAVGIGSIFGGPVGGAAAGAAVGGMGGGGIGGALGGGALGGLGGMLLGSGAGSALGGGMQGATQGSGLLGGLTGGSSGLGSLFGGGGGLMSMLGGGSTGVSTGGSMGGLGGLFGGGSGGLGSILNIGSSLLSGGMQSNAINKMEDQKLEMERQRMAQLQPYNVSGQAANQALAGKLASGELGGAFNPGDLTKEPGYQFDLQQGEQALGRKQAATGNYFSGQALKEAQDYGTGLADKTYGNAYQRWLQNQQNTYNMLSGQSAQGINAATGVGNIYSGMGDVSAGATGEKSNTLNQTLAALLSGSGAIGQKRPTVINGQVVYV